MITVLSNNDLKGYRLTEEEIVMHCRFLLPGGIETTWRNMTNMFVGLLSNPAQWRAVTEDLALVDQAVEEGLRWGLAGTLVPRRVAVDTEVSGVALPAGAAVNNVLLIANRDRRYWEDPDAFDIFRLQHPHLSFHAGVHYCMGQNLARGTLRIALREVARRLPRLSLACDATDLEMAGFALHVVRQLPVRL
jgi:cytochrome P450